MDVWGLRSEGSTRGYTQVVSTNYYVFWGSSEGVMSVRLKRPSLRFTRCNYGFIYMRGGCALTVHSCGMTVQCCAYTTVDCALLRTVLEAQSTTETVQLCKLCNCAAWEWSMWNNLTYRDRGWLRLGLRHFVKWLSCESCEDCTWCVMWGLQWRMHVIMFVGNTRLYEHLFRHLFGRLRRKRIGVSKEKANWGV